MKSYFVPAEQLSDVELKTLSAELAEAYQRSGPEDDYWIDDEGEARYYEMQAEIHRRFRLANPDWKPITSDFFMKEAMTAIARNIGFSNRVAESFNAEFTAKVGDAVTIRHPVSFRA